MRSADWPDGATGLPTAEREELARLRKGNCELRMQARLRADPSTEMSFCVKASSACTDLELDCPVSSMHLYDPIPPSLARN